ncbi:MAG: hypothetical protein WBM98_17115 [Maribacter sp.]|uniref:hypothetical protein n=1 Tax=Maribacter sp. TaxID=1897614 RepID=UPI003C713160
MKKLLFSALALVSINLILAQNSVTGTISGWQHSSADIVTGMQSPIAIGTVKDDGSFTLNLTPEFSDQTMKSIDEFNKNSEEWKTSVMTLEKAFTCYGDSLAVTNGNVPVIKLSNFGGYDLADPIEKKIHGSFMMVNTKGFAETYRSYGQYNAIPGYFLDWFYFAEPSSVFGECTTESYAVNQEETYKAITEYQLEFKAGWNLVQYEIAEIFTDKEGLTYALRTNYKTLDKLPEGVQYIYFEDQ